MLNTIKKHNIPQHVAIIMDGNGRWAKKQGEIRTFGHVSGVESVREALKAATEVGVKYLTLYAFSSENWNRPKEEIDALMNLLVSTIASEKESLHENGVQLKVIGDVENLPEYCRVSLQEAIDFTQQNTTITLVLALSYSSRWEITNAMKHIAQDLEKGKITSSEINQDILSSYMETCGIPDPELLIRTSGESRISNFLLWQLAYTELYFTDVLWPDFKKEDFYNAIIDFQSRERRFGKISEQLTNE
jgi:undecaprenyl diphosphate synthase